MCFHSVFHGLGNGYGRLLDSFTLFSQCFFSPACLQSNPETKSLSYLLLRSATDSRLNPILAVTLLNNCPGRFWTPAFWRKKDCASQNCVETRTFLSFTSLKQS
uniref:Uncharacterized protein n=1 Tax=Sphaerodactylus townsendi TaxID=933632 RepID=A0ACB8FST1_9SAUR